MANNAIPGMVVTYVRSTREHASATIIGPSRHGDNCIHLNPIHPMPPTVNKDKQNIWRVARALYHALCKVRGPRVLCCHMCRVHARRCLSTGWALNRRFDLTFGTAAMLAQGGGGYS